MTAQHDSAYWETVSGWMWGCRTCLDRGFAVSETDAQEKREDHDGKPLPWWVPLLEADRRLTRRNP